MRGERCDEREVKDERKKKQYNNNSQHNTQAVIKPKEIQGYTCG